MKAQAKKILALIMAMVMCLSLAAPAFATYTPPATPAAYGTVETTESYFKLVAVDAAGKELPDAIKSTYTVATVDGTEYYYDGASTYYTISSGDAVAVTSPSAEVTGATYAAVPTMYKATENHITRITGDNESGTYTVYGFKNDQLYTATGAAITEAPISSASVTATKQPDYIKVTENAAVSLIGQPQTPATYIVEPASGVSAESGVKATVTIGESNPAPKSFDDVKDSWTPLAKNQVFKANSDSKYYEVDGFIYQEPQGNGLVKAYFALYPLTDDGTGFDETKDLIYLVNPTPHATFTEAQYGNALKDAYLCSDNKGTKSDTAIEKATGEKKVAIYRKSTEDAKVVYGFKTWNASKDLTVDDTNGTATADGFSATTNKDGTIDVTFDKDSELTTATFDVQILATSMPKTGENTTAYVTNVDEATKLLKKDAHFDCCTLTSVAAASGDTLTVTVTKAYTKPYDTNDTTAKYGKNVWFYFTPGAATPTHSKDEIPLLIDVDKEGFYNATSNQGANAQTIEAGKKALGPVLVKASQVNDGSKYDVTETAKGSLKDTSGTYYVFDSVEDMQKNIVAKKCTDGKDIEYIQVTLNPYKGNKQNKLVTVLKKKVAVTVGTEKPVTKTLVEDTLAQPKWSATKYIESAEDTDTYTYEGQTGTEAPGAIELASDWWTQATATSNADFVEKGTWTIPAAEHGTKVNVKKTTARTCEKAGSEVTETVCEICNQVLETSDPKEIPADNNPLEYNPDAQEGKPETKVFGVGNKTTDNPGHKSSHWAEKAVTETTTSEDKSETIITTTIYCNYGVAHDKIVNKVQKTSLQNSGRWNHFSADGRKADQVLNSSGDAITNMFGYEDGITIADSDVELESLPLNRKVSSIPKDNKTTTVAKDDTTTFKVSKGDDLVIKFPAGTFSTTPPATEPNGGVFVVETNPDKSMTAYQAVTLNDVYATATGKPVTKYYVATLTAKTTKERYYDCQTGLATLSAQVYEVDKSAEGFDVFGGNKVVDAVKKDENLEKNLKSGKVTLLQTYPLDNIVIRAKKYHDYDEKTGICKNCLQGVQAVEEAMFTADTVTVESLNWTGKVAQPKVTVFDTKQNYLLKGVDYVVEEIDDTDAGEYTITIKGLEDYSGNRVTVPFTINKVAATLKKKSAPKTLTANKNKAVTGQIKMTVKGGKVAKYKVTGKVAGVSVNKKGKITVKKGNKKAGTLKVKVSMKADKNHTAAKAVTVKVAIKAAKK